MPDLRGKVAVVTGASRGAGRGIALMLGEAGATVYVTGRSRRGGPTTAGQPETVDETAELVTARGGQGIAVRCDHTVDVEVAALFACVQEAHGRLDVLVNNAWGGYEDYNESPFDAPFWEQPLWRWDKMFSAGVRAHMVSSYYAAPLMLPQRQGLIVNITTYMKPDRYDNGSPFYDIAKTAINRMALVMAEELRPYNIAAVALSPGWMRTEGMLRAFNTDEVHWRQVPDLSRTESPLYVGRAVAALAADPQVMAKTGRLLTSGGLAQEYGFTDVDGRQPDFFGV
ncbi:MAG: SDR family NAD(P)-dependent oxidoreductase [Chloroflexi bacterium]|nr:SDR family NAD(P)-dependent oxidoreductase [Chloroflexota bacterium]MCI0575158.1 SDR family NAD(P)-dependent oxidoreductase [Chloroflexota bacterium]MCI0647160.1 SDR family NAD(P)-dependent oxidoreductase [Chloroflexota bacterium]MCI0729964.1 SDR family NAD(P)-dependent oxidoreductase [Chloroflexota bacterium]